MFYNAVMPGRERSFRVEAIVMRHSDWGESDRLLTLFTRELGKLRVIAKGVRKPRSRKAGHLEPLTQVSLLLARGRDLPIVTQAETINPFTPLKDDLLLLGYASYLIELLDRFTIEEEENQALYRILADSLMRLSDGDDAFCVLRYYELRLLDLVGFRPQLFHCAACQREIQPEDQFFSAEGGGVLCPKCGAKLPGSSPITVQALKYLRHYQRSSYPEARRARIDRGVAREMESVLQDYLTYLLERGLNSPAFIKRVKNLKARHAGG